MTRETYPAATPTTWNGARLLLEKTGHQDRNGRRATQPQDRARRTILDACGGTSDKLVKAMAIGMIRGIAGIIGRFEPGEAQAGLVRELISQDILVLVTESAPDTTGKPGHPGQTAPEEVGVGLAEFCDNCDLTPVLPVNGLDILGMLGLCAPLASAFGVAVKDLPVAACGPGSLHEGEIFAVCAPTGASQAISRHIAARRLALGLNDRLDGTVYS